MVENTGRTGTTKTRTRTQPQNESEGKGKGKGKGIADLQKEIKELNTINENNKQVQIRNCLSMRNFLVKALDPNLPDKELILNLRSQGKGIISDLDSFLKKLKELDK